MVQATGSLAEEFQFLAGAGGFSFTNSIQTGPVSYLASCPVDTGNLFLGIKWLGCVADHSPLSSAQFKDVWSYTSTSLLISSALKGINKMT
jgi:hypothetical protein